VKRKHATECQKIIQKEAKQYLNGADKSSSRNKKEATGFLYVDGGKRFTINSLPLCPRLDSFGNIIGHTRLLAEEHLLAPQMLGKFLHVHQVMLG